MRRRPTKSRWKRLISRGQYELDETAGYEGVGAANEAADMDNVHVMEEEQQENADDPDQPDQPEEVKGALDLTI